MQGKLTDCLSGFLHRRYGISREILAFNEEELPEHLQLKIRVLDEQGNCLEQGNDLYHLQQKLSGRASEEFHAANEEAITRSGLTDWTFGSLPGEIEIEINGQCVPAYPVLRDDENTVSIILHDMADAAERINASGLRRLCMLRLAKSIKYLEKNIAFGTEIKLLYSTIGEVELFIDEMIKKIFHVVFINGQQRPCTREEFDTLIATGEKKLVEVANDLAETICDILQLRNDVLHTLAAMYENISDDIHEDITHQVNSLIYDGFLAETPVKWLRHYPRFLHAIQKRMNRAGFGNSQERQKMQILHEYEQYYYDLYNNCAGENQVYDEIDTYRWMLQEYRVSLFAQPMKTSMPISLKRLDRQLELIKKA